MFFSMPVFCSRFGASVISLSARERDMGDSEERMCSWNDTRQTALKLKSLFSILGTGQGAAKGAPTRCLTPVLPAGAGEYFLGWDSRTHTWAWAGLGSVATTKRSRSGSATTHAHPHTNFFQGLQTQARLWQVAFPSLLVTMRFLRTVLFCHLSPQGGRKLGKFCF